MCGACPGGAVSSKLTQLLGVLGIGAAFTTLVDAAAGPHWHVTRFGESWTVRTSTGQNTVVHSVEALLEAVSLSDLPAEMLPREAVEIQAALSRLDLLRSGPLAEPAVRLSAAELLTALRLERSCAVSMDLGDTL